MKAEGVQSPEMEAILKATAEDAIWNTIERFKGMDMSNKKKMIVCLARPFLFLSFECGFLTGFGNHIAKSHQIIAPKFIHRF